MAIRLCVFDLGGTIVDKYSLSPFLSLKNVFKNKGINIDNSLIFKDMGKNKHDHINLILNDKSVSKDWFRVYSNYPDLLSDTQEIYEEFNRYQLNEGIQNIEILPETKKCINLLQENNISTGVTTGFNRPIMKNIREKLIEGNIYLDNYVSSTCLGKSGRPAPYMINYLMDKLSLSDPRKVIKVDDTVVGLQEGINAGCITVGVAKWSSYMKMKSYDQVLSKEEYIEKIKHSKEILMEANPDFIITSLDELYPLIEKINYSRSLYAKLRHL